MRIYPDVFCGNRDRQAPVQTTRHELVVDFLSGIQENNVGFLLIYKGVEGMYANTIVKDSTNSGMLVRRLSGNF